MSELVHDLIFDAARRSPSAPALVHGPQRLDYAGLASLVRRCAGALLALGLGPAERVAVYLEKRVENVGAMFGAAAAGGVFVPLNPLLRPEQVGYILADCQVSILVTSPERYRQLAAALAGCPQLRRIIVTGDTAGLEPLAGVPLSSWDEALAPGDGVPHRRIDADLAAILYTSGSTGKPKGVVLSHRNLVAGAHSVASYLEITPADRILAVLPLSFDYGLSQLTTSFARGAAVVLLNHLFARDVLTAVAEHGITGLAAVPPLWMQLAQLPWPAPCSLRFLTNSGGAMPRSTVEALRTSLPDASLFLMYGLTEAFRSTYLPPAELAHRPDSIGRAIPNAQVMVVRPDGTPCGPGETGELVHRGALVALGYWNDPQMTATRFRPAPGQDPALPLPELAVWSGDRVRIDADGYLYFVGRSDDMIKVSGYRVSPTEVEEVLHATALLAEVAAFGVPHPQWGEAIVAVAVLRADQVATSDLLVRHCHQQMPAYMVPARIVLCSEALPRNPNGKLDRKLLQQRYSLTFESAAAP